MPMKPKIPKDIKGALLDLYYNGNNKDLQILAGIVLELFKKSGGGIVKEARAPHTHQVTTHVTTSTGPFEDEDEPDRFINHYRCPYDGTEWDDSSPYTNNDRCPECNAEIEPYESEDIVEEGVFTEGIAEDIGKAALKYNPVAVSAKVGKALPAIPGPIGATKAVSDIADAVFTAEGEAMNESKIKSLGSPLGMGEWFEGMYDTEDGRSIRFQAKVYGQRSDLYGVFGSAISKLSLWDESGTEIFAYDRGFDFDELKDEDLLMDILTYIETESGIVNFEEE